MDRTLAELVEVLRRADVRISVSETLDAVAVAELIGLQDRQRLKHGLGFVLAKSQDEKERFERCFDHFFNLEAPKEKTTAAQSSQEEQNQMGEGQGRGGGAGSGSAMGQMMMAADPSEQQLAMARAFREVGIERIQLFTQIGLYTHRVMEAMGLEALDAELLELDRSANLDDLTLAMDLRTARDDLRARVRDRVEQEYLLRGKGLSEQMMERGLRRSNLSNLALHHHDRMRKLVRKLAKKLVALHSRRKRVEQRGQLDVRRTLRGNLAYGGRLFVLKWRSKKIDRPKIFVICDISGSVSNVANFLLMFLYSMREILPKLRAFVFSSELGEVTGLFKALPLEEAVAEADRRFGAGATDYGAALQRFTELCLREVDYRSTVLILGDGRNNRGNPRLELLKQIHGRAGRVIWLNPESPPMWRVGDSEMLRYRAYCTRVEVVRSLLHLERVVASLPSR